MTTDERRELTNDAIRFLEDQKVTTVEKHNIVTSDKNVLEIPFCVSMEAQKRAVKEWSSRMSQDTMSVEYMTSKEIRYNASRVPINLLVESYVEELKDYLGTLH